MCWKFTPWVKFYFGLSLHILLRKTCATPGACIKPGCLAQRPLCHKVNLPASCEVQHLLCHKVNPLSCVARRLSSHRVNLPSCVARQPLFHKVNLPRCEAWRRPLFHKVNLPRREARQHHFIMTCDIFGTGQTNILALCYLFGKTWPAHSSPTQATEINTLHQITGKVIDVSRTHIPLKALMIPLRRVKLRGVV